MEFHDPGRGRFLMCGKDRLGIRSEAPDETTFLKYYLKALSLILGQDLKHKYDKFFKYFDEKRLYRDKLVIRLERISKIDNEDIFDDKKYF